MTNGNLSVLFLQSDKSTVQKHKEREAQKAKHKDSSSSKHKLKEKKSKDSSHGRSSPTKHQHSKHRDVIERPAEKRHIKKEPDAAPPVKSHTDQTPAALPFIAPLKSFKIPKRDAVKNEPEPEVESKPEVKSDPKSEPALERTPPRCVTAFFKIPVMSNVEINI